MSDDPDSVTVYYEPDPNDACIACGQSPTVMVVNAATGEQETHLHLCGPCCWGEAETVDPSTWNG